MTKGDDAVEGAAPTGSTRSPTRRPRSGGFRAKLADELADDAAFLRKLKPTLIAARARGSLPRDGEPDAAAPTPRRTVRIPARPALLGGSESRAEPFRSSSAPPPAVGVLLAKIVDWRGHAHPRR